MTSDDLIAYSDILDMNLAKLPDPRLAYWSFLYQKRTCKLEFKNNFTHKCQGKCLRQEPQRTKAETLLITETTQASLGMLSVGPAVCACSL